MVARPGKGLIDGQGRRPARQHGGDAFRQRRYGGPVPARRMYAQGGSRGLGQHTGLGLVGQGGDAAVRQCQLHADPVAAGRIVGLAPGIGPGQGPGTLGIGSQAQQGAGIEFIRHRGS